LIAEVLLQRTRADQVVPVFEHFKKAFRRPRDLADASELAILRVVGPLGLHWRARFLKRLGRTLVRRGRVPERPELLMSLPGIGPYAANAYASFHAGTRGVLLDSNLVRFYGRLLGLPTGPETRRTKLFRDIAELATPPRQTRAFNYALLDFTRSVCRPKPCCTVCPLLKDCRYGPKGSAAAEPRPG
jgi:A/G-specific adenine glycosylase